MAVNLTPVETKISSFLVNGFLSGNDLEMIMKKNSECEITTSYDDKLREFVPLNCISEIAGIRASLFNPAKGGLVVMVEEKVGQSGILDNALLRNAELIEAKEREFSEFGSYAQPAARKFALCKDDTFVQDLTEKVHKTALFILDGLEVNFGETQAQDGCKKTGRKSIPPKNIRHILLPAKFRDECHNLPLEKLIFVDSAVFPKDFIFCYKDEKQMPQQIQLTCGITIPDFASALRKLTFDRNLNANPLYTHMTRLP